jgi:hypothetical protein
MGVSRKGCYRTKDDGALIEVGMARTSPIRLAVLVFGLMAGSTALSASALAQALAQRSCADDIGRLEDERKVESDRLKNIYAHGKGKIDPAAVCGQGARLQSADNALLAYMEKNQDLCDIPEAMISGLKENNERWPAFFRTHCGA